MKEYHFHLISDSTGETVLTATRASLARFKSVNSVEHIWSMVRNKIQMQKVVDGINKNPGFVIFTFVNSELRKILEDECRKIDMPCVSLLDPIIANLGNFLDAETHTRPGKQHVMDAEYFSRIEAVHFALNHDDGQSTSTINQADVIILGVSRTSKTPTCIYLANRGIKAANIPLVPGSLLPPEVIEATTPIIIGLVNDPKRLVQIRRNRLRFLKQDESTDYIDIDTVIKEINESRKLFTRYNWPVIDVTRRSIEEVAAMIIQLHKQHRNHLTG
ncbi:MAG: phosphoenolpyruvate synthase regulatory protein [Rhodospirillales bacterium RIFCSPLOWO2_12_FULL_58_28]|nr:MAG: phosphoenolpyruvate synthase regulatory protein [Rhodospirillales bacterium RIFCSPLOWO2_02_FULL_58_16]OHC79858.1 MAG: phosphoenolpyruvate synthase regulatory protein [Rhodospirillales bacterium RIFCSPLOWO2_12_FULL_58_28]